MSENFVTDDLRGRKVSVSSGQHASRASLRQLVLTQTFAVLPHPPFLQGGHHRDGA